MILMIIYCTLLPKVHTYESSKKYATIPSISLYDCNAIRIDIPPGPTKSAMFHYFKKIWLLCYVILRIPAIHH